MLSFKTIVSRFQSQRKRVIFIPNVVKSTFTTTIASNNDKGEMSNEKEKPLTMIPLESNLTNQSSPVDEDKLNECDTYLKKKMAAYNEITGSVMEESLKKDEEKYQHKLSQIIEIFYSLDETVRPKEMTAVEIDYMVKMRRPVQIRNFLRKIARMEDKNKMQVEYKQKVKEAILSRPKPEFGVVFDTETGKPIYKFHNICMICSWLATKRIRDHQIAQIARFKLLDSPKIIIDFDYDHHMTIKQHMTITAQAKFCLGILKSLPEPVNLFFCNLKPESPVSQYLNLDFESLSSHMIEVTSQSYLDLFPKERLVYLTADTDNLLNYDPDDIYIIGGMIDALTNEPLSALKAQREGLRTAKLPLNDYVRIRNEVKSLKISQVFGIICQLSSSSNYSMLEALEKYITSRIQTNEQANRLMEKHENQVIKSRETLKTKFNLTDEETDVMLLLSQRYIDGKR